MLRYIEYDYLVVNDDLERAGRAMQAIAIAARSGRRAMDSEARKILDSFGG
jgi:guanylate kinase